ncbi:MAG: hypothetical protein NTZ05_01040, partial [Chloroflexi bacterium]|nr:hypothetical protein [Chloroflexota bacterium]
LGNSTCPPKLDGNAPLPSAPIGALLGRIGGGSWFMIGSNRTFIADRAGRLSLLYNDTYRGDNDGRYEVMVTLNP